MIQNWEKFTSEFTKKEKFQTSLGVFTRYKNKYGNKRIVYV